MTNCPKCNAKSFKKIKNSNGTHYYRCSSCGYETNIIRSLLDFLNLKR